MRKKEEKRGPKEGKPGATKSKGGCPYCDHGPFRRLNQHISMCHKEMRVPTDVEDILQVPKADTTVELTLISCAHCHYVTISEIEMDRHLGDKHWTEALTKYHEDWLAASKKKAIGHFNLEAVG